MFIVVHYSEIGLKGKNRAFFEKKLVQNLKSLVKRTKRVYRLYGKIIAEVENSATLEEYIKILAFIPGVSSFALAERSDLEMKCVQKTALALLSAINFDTFRVTTKRSNKQYTLNSDEINVILGEVIRKKLKKKVSLNNPTVTLFVEVSAKEIFLYTHKYRGIGGLPVGSSGKAIASLSGGIDSPVASFLAAKRGVKVIFCHIQNKTILGRRVGSAKIESIVKALTKVQGESKLYIIPYEEIQKAIISCLPAEFRMIVYRRFMMKIMEKIALKEKAGGIITGDSLGQVASQTLENLKCIYQGLALPVLSPLIGMNKEEIIQIAKEIGTYEHSILPYPDCCSFMIAQHPETRADLEKIKKLEELIPNKEELVEKSIDKMKVKIVTKLENR